MKYGRSLIFAVVLACASAGAIALKHARGPAASLPAAGVYLTENDFGLRGAGKVR